MKLRALVVFVVVLMCMFATRHYVVDDGLIYSRFIQNALAGNGLVFNLGESINSLTSPLFSYLLLGFSWLLRGHILVAEHLFYGLTLFAVCLAAETEVHWSGVAIASTAYFYTLIGLESSLFLLMILLVAKVYAAGKYDYLPVLLVLTLLTRFEGGLLIPIVGFQLWRERRLPRFRTFIPALLVLAFYLALNHHWYGSILPNSASSKFGQARSGYWGKWPMGFLRPDVWALSGKKGMFHWTFYIVPLTIYFGIRGWRRSRGERISNILGPFWLGLLLFYTVANMPSDPWYYAPLIFIAMFYAVRGIPSSHHAMAWLTVVLVSSGITNVWFLTK